MLIRKAFHTRKAGGGQERHRTRRWITFAQWLISKEKTSKLEKLSDECRNRSQIVAKVAGFTQNNIIPSLVYQLLTCWIKRQSHCLESLQTAAFLEFFISRHSSEPGSGIIFRPQVLICLKIFWFLFGFSLLAWFQFFSHIKFAKFCVDTYAEHSC